MIRSRKTSPWRIIIAAAALLALARAPAHHSFPVTFNTSQTVEIAGTVAELRWIDPHIYFYVDADSGERWTIESNSIRGMLRRGVSAQILAPGAAVTVAGFPARNGDPAMYSSHLLLPDGTEIVLRPGSQPRWSAAGR